MDTKIQNDWAISLYQFKSVKQTTTHFSMHSHFPIWPLKNVGTVVPTNIVGYFHLCNGLNPTNERIDEQICVFGILWSAKSNQKWYVQFK